MKKKSSETLPPVVFPYLISARIFLTSLDTTIPLITFNDYNCFLLRWQSVPVTWGPCPHACPLEPLRTILTSSLPNRLQKSLQMISCVPSHLPGNTQFLQLVPFDLASRFFSLSWLLFSGLSRLPWTHTDAKNCPHNTRDVSPIIPSITKLNQPSCQPRNFQTPLFSSGQHCQRRAEGWDCSYVGCSHFCPLHTSHFWTQLTSLQMQQIHKCKQTHRSARTWPANN